MTLIELMISVVIMVLMMLAFGMIVSDAQKVVTTSENTMRGNMTADAIARNLKRDISRITKDGFLCIATKETNNNPVLIFTTNGTTYSRFDNISGENTISIYGHANNDAPEANSSLLLRLSWVLNNTVTTPPRDVWQTDLDAIQDYSRFELCRDVIDSLRNLPSSLTVPSNDWNETQNTWEVLSLETSNFAVLWTDGTRDANNNTNWYGVDPRGAGTVLGRIYLPKNLNYEDLDDEAEINVPANIEFQSISSDGYTALWTDEDTTNWPTALKIRFRIWDKEFAEEHSEGNYTDYEVICDVP